MILTPCSKYYSESHSDDYDEDDFHPFSNEASTKPEFSTASLPVVTFSGVSRTFKPTLSAVRGKKFEEGRSRVSGRCPHVVVVVSRYCVLHNLIRFIELTNVVGVCA